MTSAKETVRTTIHPESDLEVDQTEKDELARQGLLVEKKSEAQALAKEAALPAKDAAKEEGKS